MKTARQKKLYAEEPWREKSMLSRNFMDRPVDKKERQFHPSPKRDLCDTCAHSNAIQNFPFSGVLQRGKPLNIDH